MADLPDLCLRHHPTCPQSVNLATMSTQGCSLAPSSAVSRRKLSDQGQRAGIEGSVLGDRSDPECGNIGVASCLPTDLATMAYPGGFPDCGAIYRIWYCADGSGQPRRRPFCTGAAGALPKMLRAGIPNRPGMIPGVATAKRTSCGASKKTIKKETKFNKSVGN